MVRRVGCALGRLLRGVVGVVTQVGGALNGGRDADEYAARQYKARRDE
jgi:hypothetical protein